MALAMLVPHASKRAIVPHWHSQWHPKSELEQGTSACGAVDVELAIGKYLEGYGFPKRDRTASRRASKARLRLLRSSATDDLGPGIRSFNATPGGMGGGASRIGNPRQSFEAVGDAPVDTLHQVRHRIPMMSIDNTYSQAELREYATRTQKLLDGDPIAWVVELKIDGVAASVIYEKGRLTQAITRGDGQVGDDITHNIRTVRGLPTRLHTDRPPDILEVRGEVYMTNADLVRLNEQRVAAGEPAYKNTRNVTAGTIRLLDSRICAQRNLRFFCHGIGYCEGYAPRTHQDFLRQAADWAIPVTPEVVVLKSIDEVVEECGRKIERFHELDFEVDGIVIKVNDYDQRRLLERLLNHLGG